MGNNGNRRECHAHPYQAPVRTTSFRDRTTSQYTELDPKFDITHVGLQAHTLKSIAINSGDVVHSIRCTMLDGTEEHAYGGPGGTRTTINLADDESITRVTWTGGKLGTQEVIYNLKIHTNKNANPTALGSGTGVSEPKQNEFTVPPHYKVIQLVDYASTMKQEGEDVHIIDHPHIADLKFVVRRIDESSAIINDGPVRKDVEAGNFETLVANAERHDYSAYKSRPLRVVGPCGGKGAPFFDFPKVEAELAGIVVHSGDVGDAIQSLYRNPMSQFPMHGGHNVGNQVRQGGTCH